MNYLPSVSVLTSTWILAFYFWFLLCSIFFAYFEFSNIFTFIVIFHLLFSTYLKCHETLGDLHSHWFTRSPQLFFTSSFSAHLNVLSALLLISWNHIYLIHIITYELSLFNTLLSYSSNLSIFWIYKQLKLCGYITISIWQKQNSKLIPKFFSPFCIGMWCFHSAVSMHNFDCFVYVLTINIKAQCSCCLSCILSHSVFLQLYFPQH